MYSVQNSLLSIFLTRLQTLSVYLHLADYQHLYFLKKFFSIFMLFAFIAPFLGVYMVHKYQQKKIRRAVKQQMIAGIDADELVHFKFTLLEAATLLNWKHSKEFEYLDQWYDVVKADTVADTIHYALWWDAEETELNKSLKATVQKLLANNPQNKKNNESLLQFSKKLFWLEARKSAYLKSLYFNQKTGFLSAQYQTLKPEIAPPPPKFIFFTV